MAYRQTPFVPGEWYHCYSRSVDRKKVFETARDYERFVQALYLCNSAEPVRRYDLRDPSHADLLGVERGSPVVAVGAYCLMPNHFHILIQEKSEGGISKFMHKVGTSFSMYFNIKNSRIGNVFIKPFRSKHIASDTYIRRAVQYIHLNPAELYEPHWKDGVVRDVRTLENKLIHYTYSSLPDYRRNNRIERSILDASAMEFLRDDRSLASLLSETAEYYGEISAV